MNSGQDIKTRQYGKCKREETYALVTEEDCSLGPNTPVRRAVGTVTHQIRGVLVRVELVQEPVHSAVSSVTR